jgi:glycosyltransferase involved in cell wall biosynthesis
MTSLAVVIPVRDVAQVVGRCLDTVLPQAAEAGAQVIVVDDASSDGTAGIADAAGAQVVRRARAGGPYVARNDGWRAAGADRIVFTDARARARPGWLRRLVSGLDDPDVAVAGGDVVVSSGPTIAQRWAHTHQHLAADRSGSAHFLPFAPTCNMAVARSSLEMLGGFRPLNSGGDVDLCWRAQLAGLGRVEFVGGADMDWEPRESVRETIRQWKKYGRAVPRLYSDFSDAGCTMPPAVHPARQLYGELRAFLGTGRSTHPWTVDLLDRVCRLTYGWAYWRSSRALAEGVHAEQAAEV